MTQITIRIPAPLRTYAGGADELPVEAATVCQALTALAKNHDLMMQRVLTREGRIAPIVPIMRHFQALLITSVFVRRRQSFHEL